MVDSLARAARAASLPPHSHVTYPRHQGKVGASGAYMADHSFYVYSSPKRATVQTVSYQGAEGYKAGRRRSKPPSACIYVLHHSPHGTLGPLQLPDRYRLWTL